MRHILNILCRRASVIRIISRRLTETDTFPLPPGASLLLTTDGVTEARDRHGVFYDPVRGLAGHSFDGPQELVDTVVREVTAWSGGRLHDDMAVLALTRREPPEAEEA